MRGLPLVASPLALLLAASLAFAGDSAVSPVDEAMRAFQEGDYAKAVKTADGVGADDPLYAKAQYIIGEGWLAVGDPGQAEKAFRKALAKKPESGPLVAGLGRALTARGVEYAGLGRADDAASVLAEADTVLRNALKIDPKDAVAHRALGECLAAQGKPADAKKELEIAFKADPKDPLAARSMVEFLLKQGEPESAEKYAETCLQADPKGPMGYFLRGLVLDRQKKGKEAIEAYEAALAKDGKMLDAHKNLAILCITDNPVYSNKERTKKAMEHFAKYFELGGRDEALRETYEQIKGFVGGATEK